jgi:polyisoprenyl-teichoic acid--peptidoglycan teichoic acid transferase
VSFPPAPAPPPFAHRPVPAPRRRSGAAGRLVRRLGTSVLLAGALTLVALLAGQFYASRTWASVPSVAIPSLAAADGGPVNYLIVGSDSRAFVESAEDEASFGPGDARGALADVIMIVRVDPDSGGVLLVSIPRDTWVVRPDGTEGRINATFSAGPEVLVQTIRQEFGVEINHYLEVDFAAVREVIDAVGGVDVFVETSLRDAVSGLAIDVPGPQFVHLDGDMGLAYVRARHLERLVDGQWQPDPTADLGRIQRQQVFMQALANRAIERATSNPLRANGLVDDALAHAVVDDELGLAEAVRLVQAMRELDPADPTGSTRLTIPTRSGRVGEASVLFVEPGAEEVFARLRGPVAPPSDPSAPVPADVTVEVRNGTGRGGLAATTREQLGERGFGTADVGDAPATAATELRHRPGEQGAAELVRAELAGPAVLVEDASVDPTVDVVLVLGDDFAGLGG